MTWRCGRRHPEVDVPGGIFRRRPAARRCRGTGYGAVRGSGSAPVPGRRRGNVVGLGQCQFFERGFGVPTGVPSVGVEPTYPAPEADAKAPSAESRRRPLRGCDGLPIRPGGGFGPVGAAWRCQA